MGKSPLPPHGAGEGTVSVSGGEGKGGVSQLAVGQLERPTHTGQEVVERRGPKDAPKAGQLGPRWSRCFQPQRTAPPRREALRARAAAHEDLPARLPARGLPAALARAPSSPRAKSRLLRGLSRCPAFAAGSALPADPGEPRLREPGEGSRRLGCGE